MRITKLVVTVLTVVSLCLFIRCSGGSETIAATTNGVCTWTQENCQSNCSQYYPECDDCVEVNSQYAPKTGVFWASDNTGSNGHGQLVSYNTPYLRFAFSSNADKAAKVNSTLSGGGIPYGLYIYTFDGTGLTSVIKQDTAQSYWSTTNDDYYYYLKDGSLPRNSTFIIMQYSVNPANQEAVQLPMFFHTN
jgi:hypothetical protein